MCSTPSVPRLRLARLRALGAAALALATAVTLLGAPPAAAVGPAWGNYNADPGNTRKASAPGPSDPGLKWNVDLSQVQTPFAPDGYSLLVGSSGGSMPLVGNDGVLVLPVNNHNKQYTDNSSRREVIGLDPDDGSVLWEIGDVGTLFTRCDPALDSRGRVWVRTRVGPVIGHDPATGEPVAGQEVDGVPNCDSASLPIGGSGPNERLVLFRNDEIVAVDVSQPAGQQAEIAWSVHGDDADFERVSAVTARRRAVFTRHDTVIVPVRAEIDGDNPRLELLELSLSDGSERSRTEVPIADPAPGGEPASSGEYSRAHLMVYQDTLMVGPVGGPIHTLAAISVGDGGPRQVLWTTRLDAAPNRLSAGDGVVITQPGGTGSLVAVNLTDGTLAWDGAAVNIDGTGAITDLNGDAYSRVRHVTARPRHVAQIDGQTGEVVWRFGAQSVADAAGVEVSDLGVAGFANLLVQPIDADGTLYLASRSSNNNGLLAIDNSGGLAEFVEPDEPDDPDQVPLGDPGVSRVSGFDGQPRNVAIELCGYLVDDGGALRVVLARDDDFADALAGSALPGAGCILFTPGGPGAALDPAVAAEIDRALAPNGHVVVLGGEQAVSAQAFAQIGQLGYSAFRVFGPTRYETAEQVAEQIGAEVGVPRPEVILASGADWPDAITGGAYAAARTAPVLLTPPPAQTPPEWSLHPATQRALAQLNPSRTWVVGGPAVVGDAAAAAAPGAQRVAGPNRMATARGVAEQMWPQEASFAGDRFVVANLEHADGWVLALAAARLSAEWSAPQLGLRATSYPPETEGYLAGQGFTDLPAVALLGDVGFVSDEVAGQVQESVEP